MFLRAEKKKKKKSNEKKKIMIKKKEHLKDIISVFIEFENIICFSKNTSCLVQFTKCLLLCSISCAHALDSTYFESLFAFGFVHLNLDPFLRFSFVCLLSFIACFLACLCWLSFEFVIISIT